MDHICFVSHRRDRGVIFGLRGPNGELPIAGVKLAGATAIGK